MKLHPPGGEKNIVPDGIIAIGYMKPVQGFCLSYLGSVEPFSI
jgi:hypothetical protein